MPVTRAALIAAQDVPDTFARRMAIVRAYVGGDAAQEARAVACVRQHPEDVCGSAADGTGIGYADTLAMAVQGFAGDLLVREIVTAEVNQARRDLLAGDGPGSRPPSALERLMVERLLACQVHLAMVQRWYAAQWEKGGSALHMTFCEKRLEAAHRMHLSSVKALAQVRRLGLPMTLQVALPGATQVGQAGQVNVADKQVNLAEGQGRVNRSAEAAAVMSQTPADDGKTW